MLQFLVGGGGWHEQAFAVSGGETADDVRAGDGGVADGDDVLQLGFEDGVEVLGGADGDEGVGVGERREDTDPGMTLAWCFAKRVTFCCSKQLLSEAETSQELQMVI